LAVPVGLLLDAEALADVELVVELDELLLHPAASAVHVRASTATTSARFLAKREIIPRTLPLIVALRK
jgi:hypothetical protein